MSALARFLLCFSFLSLSVSSNAQNFFWDFEGPNGLEGWRNHDATPLQTGAGAASLTSLRVQTGPPVGTFDSSAFIYHVVPYDPDVFYQVTFWEETPSANVMIRAYLAWIDTLAVPANMLSVNANVSSIGTSTWHFVEYLDEAPVSGSGTYCICITASSPTPGHIFFDNVSIEMVPQTSVMMRNPRLFLGGPFVNGSNQMTSYLSDQGLVPLTEPYTALGYPQAGGGGGEWCTPMVADPGAWHNAVDWVRVELRSAADPTVIVATRQLMLTKLGITCRYNGQWMMSWNVPAGDYHVAVHHRNHLSAMTAAPIALSHSYPSAPVDFRSPNFATWGTDARKAVGAYMALWPGDANGDHKVKYAGLGNDRDAILSAIGGGNPLAVVSNVYDVSDVNLDGMVKYVGALNDRDPILVTLNSQVLGVRYEQLP